ncbi:MAG: 16S rRNA (cytosine(1402)-N(4))-methyltransferase RsmH, partial [Actinomyces graevenitzii]|nr:16S rRNA (cytosine(1402)-N(4))-methyltransferase RsmH [Actinomyces graevenitzii]
DGVLMDLGVSSLQLDEVERGFSYAHDAALDMRMDQSSGVSAQQLLDTASVQELTRYLREYGEERFASKIASAIVRRREAGKPVTSTGELVQLVRDALPAAAKRTGGNPAKRTFQALRIAVNNELEVLSSAIVSAVDVLRVDGRIVVESYQSLEDRIVKQTFTKAASLAAPVDMPVVPDDALPVVELLTRGAERADAKELEHNSRSASVRLRAARKLRQVPISQHISLNTKQRKHR